MQGFGCETRCVATAEVGGGAAAARRGPPSRRRDPQIAADRPCHVHGICSTTMPPVEPVDLIGVGIEPSDGELPRTLVDLPTDVADEHLFASLRAALRRPPATALPGRGRRRRHRAAAAPPQCSGGRGQPYEPEGDRQDPGACRSSRRPSSRPGRKRSRRWKTWLRPGSHGPEHARARRHRSRQAAAFHARCRRTAADRGAKRRRDAADARGLPPGRVLGLPHQAREHAGAAADHGRAHRRQPGTRPGAAAGHGGQRCRGRAGPRRRSICSGCQPGGARQRGWVSSTA